MKARSGNFVNAQAPGMADPGAAGSDVQILSQLEALVVDCLQVVSYKWLCRKFSIHSNRAKRILREFVDQSGSDLNVVYAVSGWTDPEQRNYSVQLVPRSKLEGAKNALVGSSSCHVYSLQCSLPKDPAQLWSVDFVQAEELFNQPIHVNNCLRDNRFSAVECALATRKVDEAVISAGKVAASAPAPAVQAIASGRPSLKPLKEVEAARAEQPVQPPIQSGAAVAANEALPGSTRAGSTDRKESNVRQAGAQTKGTSGSGAATKRKAPGPSGQGGSLANLWGRASTKSKEIAAGVENDVLPHAIAVAGGAEARLQALEGASEASSDDDASAFSRLRRGQTKRKQRQVIFQNDSSDDEDDLEAVVSLASPGLPRAVPEQTKPASPSQRQDCGKAGLHEQAGADACTDAGHANDEDVQVSCDLEEKEVASPTSVINSETRASLHSVELESASIPEVKRDAGPGAREMADVQRADLKRRRLVKKTIDERGREVYEASGAAEQSEEKVMIPLPAMPSAASNSRTHPANKQVPPGVVSGDLPAKKQNSVISAQQPRVVPKVTSKAAGKATAKGPQQGNLFAFFKKKT